MKGCAGECEGAEPTHSRPQGKQGCLLKLSQFLRAQRPTGGSSVGGRGSYSLLTAHSLSKRGINRPAPSCPPPQSRCQTGGWKRCQGGWSCCREHGGAGCVQPGCRALRRAEGGCFYFGDCSLEPNLGLAESRSRAGFTRVSPRP